MKLSRDGTEIFYEVRGEGAPLILLHPFPLNHQFWQGCAPLLEHRYRLIIPDLRGHGDSPPGEGAATMEKHARDLLQLCNQEGIGKAVFAGVSIGGYILFEFWRLARERVSALVLANTRATAETPEGRANRQKSIEAVQQRGPVQFIDEMVPRLLARTTLETRQDVVAAARQMMGRMSVQGIVANLQGMMQRPDSIATLKSINVPVLMIGGEEDTGTPLAEAELMKQHLPKARLEVVPKAGHYAALEQPDYTGKLLRGFVDGIST